MPMTEEHWTALARHLQSILPRVAPDWTTSRSHDPGITVLEVLNYALTDLQFRRPLDDSARSLARAVAGQASALAQAYDASAPRIDPYRNFKFRVKWDGRYVAGVSHVSALQRTTETVEYREGGADAPPRRMPGTTRHDPITLQRGVTYDREFESWANAVAGGGTRAPLVKDVVIELFDEGGRVFAIYKAWGCWVSQYQALPDLDANGPAVLIETLRLECEGWQRVETA